MLRFEIVDRHDVSAGSGAQRLALRVEVRTFPVTRDQLLAVALQIVEDHKGQGWQAIAVAIMYDRREVTPSFAAVEWAPNGQWSDASKGDGRTWHNYKLNVTQMADKVANPHACTVPTAQAYILNDEFNRALAEDLNADEQAVLAEIVKRHRLSTSTVEMLVIAVETWTMC